MAGKILKKFWAVLLTLAMVISLLPAVTLPVSADELAVGVELGSAALSGDKYYYAGAEVSGDGIRTILIGFSNNVVSGDTITLPTATTGFTVSDTSNDYTKRINVDEGTSTSVVQSYLRGVGFTIAGASQTASVTVTTESIMTDTFYNIDTEHYYQYIPAGSSGIKWTDAYDAAKGKTYMGRTGYLATVMSLEEDTYLNSLSGGKTGWLGGTIMTNSGTLADASGGSTGAKMYYSSFTPESVVSGDNKGWYWACGPEIGTLFYDTNSLNNEGGASSATANTVDDRNSATYYNWSRGASYEPNNKTASQAYGGNDYETCLTTLINSGHTGKQGTAFTWNDSRSEYTDQTSAWSAKGYFVEYGNKLMGDDGSGSAAFASDSGTLTADKTPPASPLYNPENITTNVAVSVTPTLTFSEELYGNADGTVMSTSPVGVIMVYEGTDNTGTALTEGAGADNSHFTAAYDPTTHAFTLTFGAALKNSQSYYVELQANRVYDAAGNTISSAEGATFTTEDASAVGVKLGNATFSGDKYYYTGVEVSGDGIRTILIGFSENVASGDKIVLPGATEGFTVSSSSSSNDYTKRINVAEGTLTSAVQSYLRGVGFATASASQTVSVTVTTENITTDTFYNIDKEHYYQYIPAGSSGITWTDAYDAAKGKTYMGRTGYLATVTDLEEDTYLNSLSGGKTGWLGGTILAYGGSKVNASGGSTGALLYYSGFSTTAFVSNGWYWACGPEIGNTFYNKNTLKGSSISVADNENSALGYYFNWGRGDEPNNTNGGENCLTTLVVGSKGKQNTLFSWNDISYDNTDQSSTYSAKGYFVEYGNKLKGDDGSGNTAFASDSNTLYHVYMITYNLNGGTNPGGAPAGYTYGSGATLPTPTRAGFTFGGWYETSGLTGSAVTTIGTTDTGAKEYWAKWTENTYAVTVNVRLNGSPSDAPLTGAVELRQSGSTVHTMTGGSGVYTVSAVNGTYDVYIDGKDTGTGVTISGLANSVSINYYTVTFTAADGGTASGSSISATYDGNSLTAGTNIVLGGKTLVITATGHGAGYYAYIWSGTGVGGENASKLTITALNRKVDALCTVTGRASAAAYSVLLNTYGGAIGSGSVTSYTYGVGATLPSDVTKDGYTFQGWYANADFSGSPTTAIGAADTGDKVFHARWMDNTAHTVGGTVDDGNGLVSGASVTIRGNGITSQSTTTDANGRYSFSGIPSGEYNIVASYNGIVQTIIITVKGNDITDADITMPTGRKNSILTVAAGTPDVVVGYLDQQFTSADNSAVDAGNSVVIRLTAEEQDENIASGAEDIQTAASGQAIGMYLDLTLLKTRSDAASSSTDTLSASETLLKIIIPYDLSGKTNVAVYRYHSGAAEAMTKAAYSSETPADECYMVNAAGNQVIVWTKSFSTYAISYLRTYAVSYDGNGATGGSVPASGTVADGTAWSSPGNPGSLVRTGYTFRGWALTASATSAISAYTINSNTVFYSVWTYNEDSGASGGNTSYTITATAGDGGSISPSGSVSVTKGASTTFTIKADKGYYIRDVLVDGVSAGAVGNYTFSNVTAVHTISAVFSETSGLPYYLDGSGSKVFIGFAAEVDGKMRYIAPDGVTVLFKENPKSFADTDGHWAESYIGFVTEREIFVGTGGNLFSPDTGMARAMFATVIGRLYERSYGRISISDVRVFTDCDYDNYYGKYVDWVAENGIILGYGNGKFGPDDQITREQMAAILYRFADFLGVLPGDIDTALTYPDSAAISSWAENAALYCQTTGIITGRGEGNFIPHGTATRAEVAATLERFIENTLD